MSNKQCGTTKIFMVVTTIDSANKMWESICMDFIVDLPKTQ